MSMSPERGEVGREAIHDESPTGMPEHSDWSLYAWKTFVQERGYPVAPATRENLIEYIDHRLSAGIKPKTIQRDIYEISNYHRALGKNDPMSDEVRDVLKIVLKRFGSRSPVISRINRQSMEHIRDSALQPRGMQSFGKARRRGETDIALISVMRDGLLLCRDAKDMHWGDVTEADDGSGQLRLRYPLWKHTPVYISPESMDALAVIRKGASDSDSVFNLTSEAIYQRIRKAAYYAGLGERFTTDSPRLGMAEDLIKAGIELPAVMAAGRWRQPLTLLHHFQEELAARGAVARMYKADERDKPWLK